MVLDHYEKSKYQKVSVLQKINLFNEGVNGKLGHTKERFSLN